MSSTTSRLEETTEETTTSFVENVETEKLTEPKTPDPVKPASKSSSTQTGLFINQGPMKNKSTQTCQNTSRNTLDKVKNKSVATQTYLTNEYLSRNLTADAAAKSKISSATQTDQIEIKQIQIDDNVEHALPDPKTIELPELLNFDSELSDRLSEDDYVAGSDDEENESDSGTASNEQLILSEDKSPQDQMKFIIFEESIVQRFAVCSICKFACIVSVQHRIGTYAKIAVRCKSGDITHNFTWSTGPLLNRLPLLHLMIASSVVSTGMECAKALRLFDSLKLDCFKRREFSNLLTAYVIPAVFSVWKGEQESLLNGIQNKSICVASDMRVDSPGHTGLFGAGSSLDVDRNVILDTQIVKVSQSEYQLICKLEM